MLKPEEVQIVAQVVLGMLNANKTTTTLEVKNFLRGAFPNSKWVQSDISDVMGAMANLVYRDNGNYREYYINEQTTTTSEVIKVKDTLISRSQMIGIIRNTKGKFFTATFTKKNGEVRVLNGQVKASAFMDDHGYISVRENGLTRTGKGAKRRIDPRTLLHLSFEGVNYSLK